jgi:RHS repeat-associated protein
MVGNRGLDDGDVGGNSVVVARENVGRDRDRLWQPHVHRFPRRPRMQRPVIHSAAGCGIVTSPVEYFSSNGRHCFTACVTLGGKRISMQPDESAPIRAGNPAAQNDGDHSANTNPLPSLNLPKGGGALRGIGEKFTANPVTGTGSLNVPVYLSPSRASLSPQLSLAYDSSSGNGPFGFGWTLSLSSVTRKTDKGIPRYADFEDSDTFLLSGAEDLMPVMLRDALGKWTLEDLPLRALYGRQYKIRRYRPRVEGLFARIERWSNPADPTDVFWRSISKDNVTSWYGLDTSSRITDPDESSHIFSWLLCRSYDDKGNVIEYTYRQENDDLVDLTQANERNRIRTAARYIKHIRYGNRTPFFPDLSAPAPSPLPADGCFELVFDYGEHDANNPLPNDAGKWECRPDPFSKYRSGFEIRTYRRCRRVLMFHHFPADPFVLANCLVRSTDLTYAPPPASPDPIQPTYSLLASVTQTGYRRNGPATYYSKSLPPVEFQYSEALLDETVRELDSAATENLPAGLDDQRYRWVDLDGEGAPGVLTEQGERWFYKSNWSPANQQTVNGETVTLARFSPVETVARKPSLAELSSGRQQLMDLSGNGCLDLALLDAPAPGFYERTADGDWEPFRAFEAMPVTNWRSSNLRFVDLTGDGLSDILLTEDDAFSWRPSLGEEGFGAAVRVPKAVDEEKGPQLILSNNAESIFLADISGDGLADLVRVRNGEVCYWPNLGYGRFGAKVTMDGSPWFEARELFDPRRIRLADIDGSGTADVIYFSSTGAQLYFNQSGNAWGACRKLDQFPQVESVSSAVALDLLGTGTACLAWSSPLASNARSPMRYIDLLSGGKPHLLIGVINNLGAETRVHYAPSTRFYIADKLAGTPWLTRLPFPVHVVEHVEVIDYISRNRFTTRYAYHHGFFDGIEREFRGFGRVDTWDTQELSVLTSSDHLPASNEDGASNVPPVCTKTWYHTGAFFGASVVSRHLEDEYYSEDGLTPAQLEAMLLPDTVMPANILLPTGARVDYDLSAEEMREACRALQGSMLRQEVYAQDDSDAAGRPYSVSERNFTVELLQPRGDNPFAVFFTHEREVIDFHYDRTLFPAAGGPKAPDPRVAHTLTISVDPFANLLLTASISYGRRHADPTLAPADQARQSAIQATFTEKSYTNAIDTPDNWRIPLPASSSTYELLQAVPDSATPAITNLFRLDEFAGKVTSASDGLHEILFETLAPVMNAGETYRRLIASSRTLYRPDDMGQAAGNPAALLALHVLEPLALPGAGYKLAFTPGLIAQTYQRGGPLLPAPASVMGSPAGDGAGYVDLDGDGRWWVPAGRTYHTPLPATPAAENAQARQHFFLPRRYEDPFGNVSSVDVDSNDLLVIASRDPLSNATAAVNDYRVLRPSQLTDPNGNSSAVSFDVLGLVAGTAVMGKPAENIGDSLAGFIPDLTPVQIDNFYDDADPHTVAPPLLGTATTRIVYDPDRFTKSRAAAPADPTKWLPAFSCSLARETHNSDLAPGQQSKIQISFVYADGFGREAQKKLQAEPGAVVNGGPIVNPRWVGNGWTIFNNKGKPVRQYEPFFSLLAKGQQFEFGVLAGVSPIVFYDPMERIVATAHPDHTFEKTVFTPWEQDSWDQNDTVLLDPSTDPDTGPFFSRLPSADYQPSWNAQRSGGALGVAEQEAATKAAAHTATPSKMYFDSLGRTFLTIYDNAADGKYESRSAFDIEGNELSLTDTLGRIVVVNTYDLLKRPIRHSGMESGERWVLNDASGKSIRAWDSRGHNLRTTYDELRRPSGMFVRGTDAARSDPRTLAAEIQCERIDYGEGKPNDQTLNLRTRVYEHRDSSGVLTNFGHNPVTNLDEGFDFKGNPLRNRRQFLKDHQVLPDWSGAAPILDPEVHMSSSQFDAMNRPVAVISPDGSIVRPSFNEANLLETVSVHLRGAAAATPFVTNVDYNARGQRTAIAYGNQTTSQWQYDPLTFRLTSLLTTRSGFPVNAQVLQNLSYVFDPTGNITHVQDDSDINNTIYFQNRRVDPTADFTYDAVYRLIQASGREQLGLTGGAPNPPAASSYNDVPRIRLPHPGEGTAVGTYTEQYQYDAAGNFLQWTHRGSNPANPGWTRNYTYNEPSLIEPANKSNRLSSTTVNGGIPFVENVTHDPHGNMTAMPQLQAIQWDFRDQLQMSRRQAVNAADTDGAAQAGERTFYIYDAGGQRLRKVTEAAAGFKTKERIYLGGFEIYREFDNLGATTLERDTLNVVDDKRFVARVDTKLGPAPDNVIRYQYDNHLGSACLELDDLAAVVTYEEYYPYGGTSYQAGVSLIDISLKRYRFSGKERDEETGFYYYGARYYPPWLGRWIQCDPAGPADGLNLYAFTRNNPVRHTDPNGMQTHDQVMQQIKKSGKAVHVMNPASKKTDGTIVTPGAMGNVHLGPKPKPTGGNSGNNPPPKPPPKKGGGTGGGNGSGKGTDSADQAGNGGKSQDGSLKGDPKGDKKDAADPKKGGDGGQGGDLKIKKTELDYTVLLAKELDPPLFETLMDFLMGKNEDNTVDTGGIPGGKGSKDNASEGGQAAYAAINLIFTFLGEALSGLKSVMGRIKGAAAFNELAAELNMGKEASEGLGAAKNTGKCFVGKVNCGFVSVASADPVPEVGSTKVANEANAVEGITNNQELGNMLRDRGLGSGHPDITLGSRADATNFMKGMPVGTKFVVTYGRTGGGIGHAINAEVTSVGLVFYDNQRMLGGLRPFFSLEGAATAVSVFTTFNPHW